LLTIASSVPIPSSDHRAHRRVEFFRVPVKREQVPVWVFKPADSVQASAGLVMNLSEGGLQVLTATDDALARSDYEMQLLLGEDEAIPRFRGRVTRMWTREAGGAGWLNGLRFDEAQSPAEAFIRAYQSGADARRWVRCLLTPVPARQAPGTSAVGQPQDTNTI
jgi:hypothetical protein